MSSRAVYCIPQAPQEGKVLVLFCFGRGGTDTAFRTRVCSGGHRRLKAVGGMWGAEPGEGGRREGLLRSLPHGRLREVRWCAWEPSGLGRGLEVHNFPWSLDLNCARAPGKGDA